MLVDCLAERNRGVRNVEGTQFDAFGARFAARPVGRLHLGWPRRRCTRTGWRIGRGGRERSRHECRPSDDGDGARADNVDGAGRAAHPKARSGARALAPAAEPEPITVASAASNLRGHLAGVGGADTEAPSSGGSHEREVSVVV
jgi:hypothetical protein